VDDPFARVWKLARNYRSLSEAYDALLARAHQAGPGTPMAVSYLRQANQLAPDVAEALSNYQEAVAHLVAFVKQ
jgi:hypothetical protein